MTETCFPRKFVFGSLSACTATCITYPLQTLAVQSQVNGTQFVSVSVNPETISVSCKRMHAKQIYKGFGFACIRQAIYGGLRLGIYEHLKNKPKINPDSVFYSITAPYRDLKSRMGLDSNSNIQSALIASSISSLITVPLDALRVQRQVNVNAFKIRNMYRGSGFTLIRNVSLGTIQYPLLTYFENRLNASLSHVSSTAIASCASSIISTLIIHPISVCKNITLANQDQKISLSQRIKYVINQRRVYAGLGYTLCRVIPHFMFTNSLFRYLENKF